MKFRYKCAAAALALLMLCGCAGVEKTPINTGDIPPASLPETTTAAPADTISESDPTVTTPVPTEPAETTAAPTLSPEDLSGITTNPLDFDFEPFVAEMFATDTLNIREYPSTEAKVVGQLNPGEKADVIGRTTEGSWYVLNFNGGVACAFGEYLSPEKPVIEEERPTLPENYYFSSASDYFFVVNKETFLPEDYSIETDFVQGSYELEVTAAYWCKKMIAAAAEDGIDLKVLSAYRTIDYQKKLFERNVNSRMEDDGMSYDEAYQDTSINIAPPGGSEHNAGLAVDIIDRNHWDTYTAFEDTEEFEWLINHCTDYGFILRYPEGKESITGYIYEPWHYRYVGVSYAKAVMDSGLCLEEYMNQNG